MKRRITVFCLCLCLILTGLPIDVLAEEGEPKAAILERQQEEEEPVSQEEIVSQKEADSREEIGQNEAALLENTLENQAFSYTQEFPQEGVKIALSAEEGVVPSNAQVQVRLLSKEEVRQSEEIIFQKLEERERQKEKRSIFDIYTGLQPSLEQEYFFDIEIAFVDSEGNQQIFEPGENKTVQVAIENIDLQEAMEDELKSVGLFYLSDKDSAFGLDNSGVKGSNFGTAEPETELLSEDTVIEEDKVVFQAEHFSTYGVVVVNYAIVADDARIAAEKKAWDIINGHADPEYFLEDPEKKDMTEAQYRELQQAARDAVAGCSSDYEKIKAITAFVADRTYYDYPWYKGISDNVYIRSYDVYTQKRTVCAGYAALTQTLLIAMGIPCMYIGGENHAYNAAYDSGQEKWIFIDTTWCSNNRYTVDREWIYGGYDFSRFDLTPEEIAELSNHEVYYVEGLLDGVENSVYYALETEQEEELWSNCNWNYSVSGVKEKNAKCVESFGGFEVTSVSEWKLQENTLVEELDLSLLQIKEIKRDTFCNCKNLKKVILPETLTELGYGVFASCSALSEIDLSPTKVTVLRSVTFSGCTALQSVKFPDTLTKIEYYAFHECSALKKLVFPKSLTEIEEQAFRGCSALKELDLSSTKIKELVEWTFYECSGLQSVTTPATLTKLHKNSFSGCEKLVKVDLSRSRLKKLEDGILGWHTRLRTVKLPDSIESIEKNAFCGCTSLKTVNMPRNLKKMGAYAFYNCSTLKELDLSKTKISVLGDHTFGECTSLKTIVLPSSLKKVGERAFILYNRKKGKNTIVITSLSAGKLGMREDGKYRWYGRQVVLCKKSYKIKFHGNGATSGNMETILCGSDVKYTLSKNKFKRKGYTFQGWNTRKNGKGAAYKDKASVKNLSGKNGKTITLYAQWKKKKGNGA